MSTQIKAVVGVVIAVLVLWLGVTYPKGNTVVQQVAQQVGAATGPDSFFDCETHNGVQTCFTKRALNQATTTICSIKSPSATSTLTYASLHINVATTGAASTLTFARSVGAGATTTAIQASQSSVGTGAEVNAVASTTWPFAPNTYLVIGQAGGSLNSTFSETGMCQAEFKVF